MPRFTIAQVGQQGIGNQKGKRYEKNQCIDWLFPTSILLQVAMHEFDESPTLNKKSRL